MCRFPLSVFLYRHAFQIEREMTVGRICVYPGTGILCDGSVVLHRHRVVRVVLNEDPHTGVRGVPNDIGSADRNITVLDEHRTDAA